MNPKKTLLISLAGLLLVGGIIFTSVSSAAESAASVASPELPNVRADPGVAAAQPSATTASAPSPTPAAKTPKPAAGSSGTPAPAPAPTPVNASGYKDGTYAASARYRTPESTESIDVSLTVKNGIVTNASIAQSGDAPESRRYQSRFASSYQQYVVGKSIASLSLSRVAGASLTSNGFDNALGQIRAQAKA